ncbi:hypothetical protein QBC32DRAFT_333772 [Pseudoneurospora amorphoporcata]|uniref:Secreted protein n=1 Tax=Pseudoneurospora amorphoporcata TaxID=241081 RepID=A0AAN6P498_9PEZI|nr:hypothetical protein QBC32DRAFT_333772 [Pseudoneurospora amorphoporcata]
MITRYCIWLQLQALFVFLPYLPSPVSCLLVQGIIPAEHRGVDGRGTYEPGSVPHTLLRCTLRTQGRNARQVSIQKSSGSLQGPLLPLTHTTFLTHADHVLLETR